MAKMTYLLDYLYEEWPTAPLQAIRILRDLHLYSGSTVSEIMERLSAPAHTNITRILRKLVELELVEFDYESSRGRRGGGVTIYSLSKYGKPLVFKAFK